MFAPTDPRSWGGGAPIFDGGQILLGSGLNIVLSSTGAFAWSSGGPGSDIDTKWMRGAAGLIGLNGNDATVPGFKQSGANVQIRLGNDSAYTRMIASSQSVNGNASAATGSIQYAEIADPAAPAADAAAVYARDSGGGKTQMVVRFNTGAVQVLATEP